MQWDEDIDLLVGKKPIPKQGRRSNNKHLDDSESTIDSPKDIEDILMRSRKMSLWSDEGTKSSRSGSGTNMIELERFQNDKKNESDDDIPIIPDIDDIPDDNLNMPDIKPVVSVNKSTYKELDSQFNNMKTEQSNIGNLSNIDLSILTSRLYPEKDVQVCSEVWTLESLFHDLSTIEE
ncbi:unnamed protein product [Psylliodes chrysocephalus]|uniref:Intraflagellar transport protein 43 homolog n=1 Tax=Psylliodes chrysocephalus TaxID=3402493 RepID=A0A9P0CRU9_9CUCU|nr:unnamed protein product [Psylliodes chrysocephala]